MKHVTWLCGVTMVMGATAGEPRTLAPDLKAAAELDGWEGRIATFVAAQKDGVPSLKFTENVNDDLIWLKGFSFDNGTIEVDIKGKSRPPQSNFIGVALRVQDGTHYDAVYFRPFNFRAEDPIRRAHAVQYISRPNWTWEKLRKEQPGQYEQPIEPAPDGDDWFHATIVVEKPKVSVFVNNAAVPSLVVNELSDRTGGSVGLWATGSGEIANFKITE